MVLEREANNMERNKYFIKNEIDGYFKFIAITSEQRDLLDFLSNEGLLCNDVEYDLIEEVVCEEI